MGDTKVHKVILENNGPVVGHMIFCPACDCGHLFYTTQLPGKPCWQFNGDFDKPTFRPSMLVNADRKNGPRCHSHVTEGKIEFCPDCDHNMAGTTVELPVF